MKQFKYLSVIVFTILIQLCAAKNTQILVLIDSDNGGTLQLANELIKGLQANKDVDVSLKKVKSSQQPSLKDLPLATPNELPNYDGIAFGSPIYFGNISTGMSQFLSKTVGLWTQKKLLGKPATVFMSAGSGAGRELAIQSFWNSLAVHGMVLVPMGNLGAEVVTQDTPQGNTVLGATSLASLKEQKRPTKSEKKFAQIQGQHFAKIVTRLKDLKTEETEVRKENHIEKNLQELSINLPHPPKPVGNYKPFVRVGNLIYINQVALKEGKILHPGKLGKTVTEEQAKLATRQTMLNVLAVLKNALNGDLERVKQCVQLTGIFNTTPDYKNHSKILNAASNLSYEVFGEAGKHARAAYGASSIPVNSVVELQAIFEVN